MALPDLLSALRAKAAERRAEELARAREEAASIRAEAEGALEGRQRRFVAKAREEEAAVARRAVARARAESAGGVLTARDHLLRRVRTALEERVARGPDDAEYRRVLEEELRLALARLPDGPVVVRAPEALAAQVREALGSVDRVTVEIDGGTGTGFVALAPDAGLEIDATLEARLEHVWPRLAVAALAEAAS